MHATLCAIVEQCSVLIAIAVLLGCQSLAERRGAQLQDMNSDTKRSIYFSIAFPEMMKIIALMLQIFDTDPTLFALFGLMIMSLQLLLLSCITELSHRMQGVGTALLLAAHLSVKYAFYSIADIRRLGGLL